MSSAGPIPKIYNGPIFNSKTSNKPDTEPVQIDADQDEEQIEIISAEELLYLDGLITKDLPDMPVPKHIKKLPIKTIWLDPETILKKILPKK